MCNKVIYACLLVLQCVPDWLVTSKMLEIPVNAWNFVLCNDDIDLDYIDSDIVTFFSDDSGESGREGSFSWRRGAQLDTPSYFKKNISNINITLHNY